MGARNVQANVKTEKPAMSPPRQPSPTRADFGDVQGSLNTPAESDSEGDDGVTMASSSRGGGGGGGNSGASGGGSSSQAGSSAT